MSRLGKNGTTILFGNSRPCNKPMVALKANSVRPPTPPYPCWRWHSTFASFRSMSGNRMQSSDVEAQVHDLPGSWQRFAQATAQGAMIRFHSRRSALSLAVFLLLSTSIAMPRAVAADDSGILRLHDRQHATGQMVPTEVPGMLAWQHPG